MLAIAEQRLRGVRGCSAPHPALPASRLGVHKELGGGTAGTADPNCPKGHSRPCDVMLSNRSGGDVGGGVLVEDWLGIGQVVVSSCFHLYHFSVLGFLFLCFFSSFP